jgi:HAD domain in Swiss Army Knife RNA repair proteins
MLTRRAMLVFLDFDGVLRKANSPKYRFDEECLERFQRTVRALDPLEIVVSSSWRDAFSLKEIRRRFAPDIAGKIIAVTPNAPRVMEHQRHREILAFLRQRHWEDRRWVAIDDAPDHFGPGAKVVLTKSTRGFDETAAESLVRILREDTSWK